MAGSTTLLVVGLSPGKTNDDAYDDIQSTHKAATTDQAIEESSTSSVLKYERVNGIIAKHIVDEHQNKNTNCVESQNHERNRLEALAHCLGVGR